MSGPRTLGAILAGGSSTRFGSDKAKALVDGQRLLDQVRAALAPQVDDIVVCGRTWPGLTALPDFPEPDLGPLGGLCGALAHARAEGFAQVLVLPVDVLPVPANLPALLGPSGPSVLAGQFLIGLWPATLAPQLEAHLRSGRRAVRSWIEASDARLVDDHALGLVNINHTSDLAG